MKKITIILSAAIVLLYTSSCKKGTPGIGTAPPGNSVRIKTLTQIVLYGPTSDTTVTTFTYDSQNRVITQTAVSHAGTGTTDYTYYTDSVVQNLVGVYSITYYLNSSGYRTSDNLGDTWTYNSGGYQTSYNTTSGSVTTYTYNSSNQMATQTNVSAGMTITDTYSYGATPITNYSGSSWQKGKSTGALLSTDVQVSSGVTTTYTYTYSFIQYSGQSVLSQETVTSSAPGSSQTVAYFTYY